jgi:hypothetical protein
VGTAGCGVEFTRNGRRTQGFFLGPRREPGTDIEENKEDKRRQKKRSRTIHAEKYTIQTRDRVQITRSAVWIVSFICVDRAASLF